MSRCPFKETGRRWTGTSRHYLDTASGKFVANGFGKMENECFGRSVGRHVGNRLKTSVRSNVDNAAFASGGHRFSEVVSERNEGLNVDLNFSLLLLEVV